MNGSGQGASHAHTATKRTNFSKCIIDIMYFYLRLTAIIFANSCNSTLVPPYIHISQGVPEAKRRAIWNVASNAYDMINHHRSRAR